MNEVMGKYRNVYAIGFSLPIWGNGRNGIYRGCSHWMEAEIEKYFSN